MSDYRRYQSNPDQPPNNMGDGENTQNPWHEPDPFAPYDDPAAAPVNTPLQEDYSAWRRPPDKKAPSFLTDDPAPHGVEMQQGGVPLFTQSGVTPPGPDFSLQEQDSPTRIGAPAPASQTVHKRKTVNRGERSLLAPPPLPLAGSADAPQTTASPVSDAADFSLPESGNPPPQQRNRRAARTARYHEAEDAGAPSPSVVIRTASHTQKDLSQGFDPFAAGDSESPELAAPRPARRPAVPGERYSGPRTAMPSTGTPVLRNRLGALPEEDLTPMDGGVRPPYGRIPSPPSSPEEGSRQQPPQGVPGQERRPRPQGGPGSPDSRPDPGMPTGGRPPRPAGAQSQRPPQGMPGPRPQRPIERRPEDPDDLPPDRRPYRERDSMPAARKPGARPPASYDQDSDRFSSSRRGPDDSGRLASAASIRRPRYDFEEEEDFVPRRRGCLMPIVVMLLIAGVALAGICLPDWTAVGGSVGVTLDGIKTSLTDVLGQAKEVILPTEVRISEFTATPAEGTAPVNVAFMIRTSKNVSHLRIVDEAETVYFEKTLEDQDTLSGIVTKNTNDLIWKLEHTMDQAFSGLLTVQTLLPDGTWDEGKPLTAPLEIEMPAEVLPAITSFDSDITQGAVPAAILFTLETSADVEAVRLVDSYGTPVASFSREEDASPQGSVIQSGDGLHWELTANVEVPYEGDYLLQYQTPFEPGFIPSEFSKYMALSQPLEEVEDIAPDADEGDDATADGYGEGPDYEGLPEGEEDYREADGDRGEALVSNGLLEDGGEEYPLSQEDGDTEEPLVPFPQETPTPTPEFAPEPTPLPPLDAAADQSASPSAINLKRTIYNELQTINSYSRAQPLSMLAPLSHHLKTASAILPSNYALWQQSGVLTFRGGPLRQNAAYGVLENSPMSLNQLWQAPVGSKKLNNATVYGITWPGQPAIVKWYTEARSIMNLNEEKKHVTALKEVILGGQDGMIYFLDLADGQPTRNTIDMGAPIGGGISVATNGTPLLGVGQSYSKLANKQVPNGYHLFNLLNGKELLLLDGRDKSANSNFSGAGGAALFDRQESQRQTSEGKGQPMVMVVGGQNGVLYTVELNDAYDHEAGTLRINPAIQRYKTQAEKQDKKSTNIEASVAMYNHYVYYADVFGVLQCVDINTLSPVWAVKTGDTVLSTPALDFEEDTQDIALYTGNTLNRQVKNGICTIRRYNALTGAEDWAYAVPELHYDKTAKIGCVASPVIGQQSIRDLVIFTVTDGTHGSRVIALDKADGSVVWTTALDTESQSSPVAVYDEDGGAWLIQAESNGNVHLMDARTGKIIHTLQLEGVIEASPAVYLNTIVIGTTGNDTGFIYGIRIE
ncbi:MAG: PQQ-binding-like beta-propeller repeat protein [Clostridia bacterium]|nr:PQQ-binding-like beta-propeller repeat protein [Clostridia bacterium]